MLRHPLVRTVLLLLLGALIPVLVLIALWVKQLPELSIWHTYVPAHEFTAERTDIKTFAQYQALEVQLLKDVSSHIVDVASSSDQRKINRYAPDSLTNPLHYKTNWNRSYLLTGDPDKASVLLVHGLSDSPYSLRALALKLHAQGYTVLGLRLPAHGTAPSALTELHWQDAAAAVRLAMNELSLRKKPIHYIGYSTGATLACEYQLAKLDGEALPTIASMTLISPAIAVSAAAKYASLASKLEPISGVSAAAWSDILPEYNPYKYNSFPLNAAVQINLLTSKIQQGFAKHAPLNDWPPTNVFLSTVDNTVLAEPVVSLFMNQLGTGRHQLMLFDLNRNAEFSPLLKTQAAQWAINLIDSPQTHPYRLQLISNRSTPESQQVSIEERNADSKQLERRTTQYAWPMDIYALSHIAMPFEPADPLFGDPRLTRNQRSVHLNQTLSGERGLLTISSNEMLRLRYNPFYALQEAEILQFIAH
ncbi:alpha/beta fold hydrolase [Chitinibacter bivalviorum]|uniref:Alpha/beta fold hydrolase n=1 Tax=Chitinibacter bivalviorum TaxID=2739434 RepID=A0A7H9BEI7_9NEIS|nr:alpha/beta fold hydrolase [Chitinibacter bivalviorum]QLG86957.1 alpha/beta fold hydrolase [Chitinibacter bivalviorum]